MNAKRTWKQRLDDAWATTKRKAGECYQWGCENKEFVFTMTPVLIGSGLELIKIISRKGTVSEQRRLKDNYVYDRRAGHYYELRRPLKTSEWIKVDELRNQGVPLGVILNDLRVLKR